MEWCGKAILPSCTLHLDCQTSFLTQIKLEKHKNCARWPGNKPINLDLGFLGPANLEEKAGALEHLPEVEDLTVSVSQIFGLVVQSVLSEMQNFRFELELKSLKV